MEKNELIITTAKEIYIQLGFRVDTLTQTNEEILKSFDSNFKAIVKTISESFNEVIPKITGHTA